MYIYNYIKLNTVHIPLYSFCPARGGPSSQESGGFAHQQEADCAGGARSLRYIGFSEDSEAYKVVPPSYVNVGYRMGPPSYKLVYKPL